MILLIRKRTLLYTWLAVCMIGLSAIFLAGSRRAFTPTGAMGQGSSAQTVVIDPGHGGQDGGAVAGDGTEESRINLAISLQLEQLLRFAGVRTELTRREDVMVCDPGLETMRQRKVSDLHNRASFVNGVPNAVLLSIHQNSLPSSPVTHGAQTFWNRQEGAEALARTLQAGLNPVVNTHRAQGAEADPGQHLFDEPCGRSRRAGGVRLSVQQGGGRAAPAGGLSENAGGGHRGGVFAMDGRRG